MCGVVFEEKPEKKRSKTLILAFDKKKGRGLIDHNSATNKRRHNSLKYNTNKKMAVNTSNAATSSAVRALALELKSLQEDPLEGIRSRLVNEENLFEWEVALFGPPDTLYQGGYFKVCNCIILFLNIF